jgi:geranyl-CoA carboxylase alpha subunit
VTRRGRAAVEVEIAGRRERYDDLEQAPDRLDFVRDGVRRSACFVRDGERLWLQHEGLALEVEDRSLAAPRKVGAAAGDGVLRATLSGRVVAVLAKAGDRVEAGQPLVTLEAMKMEHLHGAPRAGVVAALHVAAGEQVAAGAVVAVIE